MSTYCGEKFINEQLDSIIINVAKLDMRYKVDIIISDDASTDNTVNIINDKKIIYPDIYILDKARKGGAIKNFSYLIKNVSTDYDYFFFSDQDDFWLPHKLAKFLAFFEQNDSEIPTLLHSDLMIVDSELFPIAKSMFQFQKLNKSPTFSNLVVQNSVTGCVMAINKPLLLLAQKSRIDLSIMHDWYLALIASAFGKIHFIDLPTILYRQHSSNEVGAKKYSYLQHFYKLSNLRINYQKAIASQNKVLKQAQLFLEDFSAELSEDHQQALQNYVRYYDLSFWGKWRLLKQGYRKFGLVRNLIYIILFFTRR